ACRAWTRPASGRRRSRRRAAVRSRRRSQGTWPSRLARPWKAERQLAQPAVALDRGVVAVVGPVLAHASGPVRVLERLVEGENGNVDFGDECVQPADRLVGPRVAVVPGQHVGEGNAQPELTAAGAHRAEALRRLLDRAILGDGG